MVVDHYIVIIKETKQEVKQALVKIDEIKDRKKFVEEKINELKEYKEETVKDILPTIYRKISDYVSSIKNNINEQNNLLKSINIEVKKVKTSLNIFTRNKKLETLKRRYKRAESTIENEKQKISDIEKLFNSNMQENSSEEILSWMEQMLNYVPRIHEDIRRYKKVLNDYNNYLIEQISIEDDVFNAKSTYYKGISSKYLKASHKNLEFIKDKLKNYSAKQTYDIDAYTRALSELNIIVDESVKELKDKTN